VNVLSLFDGMSCGQIALNRAGIEYDNYFASEIKSFAIKVSLDNYPSTKQVGDVTKLDLSTLPKIDLLIGGSPCQDFTRLKVGGKNTGYNGEKSALFFEYVRVLQELKQQNPDLYFLLENVYMKEEYIQKISDIMGVLPIRINSRLVSIQNRDRLYWTNIPNVTVPTDKCLSFQEIKDVDEAYCDLFRVNKTPSRIKMYEKECPNVTYRNKVNCLLVKQDRRHNSGLVDYKDFCRYLTTRELEIAQTVPIGYTKCLSRSQAENVLGDGWTVDVIAHIFKELKEKQ